MSIIQNVNTIKKELTDNVTLIAVSKTRSVEEMKEAYDAGMRDFGENKVQEITSKYDSFNNDVRWHLIGHLQRNKVKYIVGKVYLIHSLDSIRLLDEIEKQYASKNIVANTLIQINIGKEESKTGIELEQLNVLIDAVEKCSNVKVKGLMCIIPKGDENQCRSYFAQVKKIFDELAQKDYKNITMEHLSMGMTSDYHYALMEGTTMIRIGEGIFGKRIYNNK